MARMTFKDLKKRVNLAIDEPKSRLFEKLHNKPFWIWNIDEHKLEDVRTNGDCRFNHIIGLPHKETIEKPIIDYQKSLYDHLLISNADNKLSIILNINIFGLK